MINLADIACSTQSPYRSDPTCNASTVTQYFPNLKQSPQTLYMVWAGCIDWSGAGVIIPWQGYNVEYFPSNRQLVFHCYTAKPWVYLPDRLMGVAAFPTLALYAVPTAAMGAGSLSIVEDDRLEHLMGDQSTEFQLATATLS